MTIRTGNGLALIAENVLENYVTLIYNRDGFCYVRGTGPNGNNQYGWCGNYSTVVEAKNAALAAGLPVTAVFYPTGRP